VSKPLYEGRRAVPPHRDERMFGRKAAAVYVSAIGLGLSVSVPQAGASPALAGTGPVCTIVGSVLIVGTPLTDVICAGAGNDVIRGLGGNDLIRGGGGLDRIYGGDGDDRIYGGLGDDRLAGGAGNDIVNGGAGRDTSFGGTGGDRLYGGDGRDRLFGGGARDLLYARDRMRDRVDGGLGRDCARVDRALDLRISVHELF
jgi:RTX calcium-binding nonapeptide repeat (4 copies)